MNDEELRKSIELHIAGAIVQHETPFDHLESFRHNEEFSKEFCEKWVEPFLWQMRKQEIDWLKSIKGEITDEIIRRNLGEFDWRAREVGAFLCAIADQRQFIDIIGTHLLKSEVCYAGAMYCRVFASFNTPECIDYLNLYLDYYLTRLDLDFDQKDAMDAILYLDKINGTNQINAHREAWRNYIKDKTAFSKDLDFSRFEQDVEFIHLVRDYNAP
jgi:hypothetical protein